jgi:hypothetical protein
VGNIFMISSVMIEDHLKKRGRTWNGVIYQPSVFYPK